MISTRRLCKNSVSVQLLREVRSQVNPHWINLGILLEQNRPRSAASKWHQCAQNRKKIVRSEPQVEEVNLHRCLSDPQVELSRLHWMIENWKSGFGPLCLEMLHGTDFSGELQRRNERNLISPAGNWLLDTSVGLKHFCVLRCLMWDWQDSSWKALCKRILLHVLYALVRVSLSLHVQLSKDLEVTLCYYRPR